MFTESAEDLFNLFMVSRLIRGVNENVIKVYYHADIKHVGEDVVHEALEGAWGVGKAERHYQPLEGSVLGAEGGFPFVTFADANEMVGVPKIYLGIDTRLSGGI